MRFVSPCLFGLEGLLAGELREMGAQEVQAENGRVFFSGDAAILARANIRSRYGERIGILMGSFRAVTFDQLFEGVKKLPFSEYIEADSAFPVTGRSLDSQLRSIPDCQSIIKKAIVESMKKRYNINRFEETGAVYKIRFSIIKDNVTIMIDSSGAGLHKRGYRPDANEAPIRETLAAAMAYIAHVNCHTMLYDPFCGSGTILIEGALLAHNIAPGLRRRFAAEQFSIAPPQVWQEERKLATELVKRDGEFQAFGSDIDEHSLAIARLNARRAGVSSKIRLDTRDVSDFAPDTEKGIVVCNPPYGERMLEVEEAQKLYECMGKVFVKKHGYSYFIISPNEKFEKLFGRVADKRRKLYNGMISCQYYQYFRA